MATVDITKYIQETGYAEMPNELLMDLWFNSNPETKTISNTIDAHNDRVAEERIAELGYDFNKVVAKYGSYGREYEAQAYRQQQSMPALPAMTENQYLDMMAWCD